MSLSAARWVERYLVLRASLMSAPSTLGAQLARSASDMSGRSDHPECVGVRKAAPASTGGRVLDDYADVADGARIWSAIGAIAQRVLELKHSPKRIRDGYETEDFERTVKSSDLVSAEVALPETQGECGAATRSGYRCRLFRRHGQARCHLHAEARPEVEQTRDGEVLIAHLDPEGTPGRRAAVLGKRALCYTNAEIGDALGMTERQVRVEVQAAYARISDWLIDREVRSAG